MKTFLQLNLLVIVGWTVISSYALAQPAVYVVRHAEKLPNWPDGALDIFHPLSAEGISRAQRLAEQFEPGALVAIFSSATTRTLHTALPLSQKLGLPIEIISACMDTAAIDSFYANLSSRFGPDQAVLLISHSNIIPYLLIKAGLPAACRQEMGITQPVENGWLFIEGYDSIWRVDRLGRVAQDCKGVRRMRF
jgi:phosphohistidine phosphatase SixA